MQVGTGRLVKGTLLVSAGRAVDSLSALAFSIIVARTLGGDYGYVSAAMGIWGIINIVSTMGVPNANIKCVADLTARGGGREARVSVRRTMLLEGVLTGMAALILYLLAAPIAEGVFGKPGLAGPLRVVSPMLFVAGLGGVWLSTFQGLHRYGYFATIISLNPLVRLGSAVAFLALGWGVQGALLGFLVGHVAALLVGTAMGAALLARDLALGGSGEGAGAGAGAGAGEGADEGAVGNGRAECVAPTYGGLLSFGAAVTVGNLAVVVFEWADKLMLAAWRPIGEVAVYTVAYGMVAVPLVLPRSVNIAFYPLVSTLHGKGDSAGLKRATEQVMRLTLMVMGFVTFTMMAVAPWLVGLLYGDVFAGSVGPFMVLALWGFIRPIGLLALSIPQGMGRPMVGTTAMVLTMCLNIALNAALIPRYGNMGAAVGTTVSYIIGNSYLAHVAFKMAGAHFPWDGAARALGSAVAAAAVVVALRYLLPGLTATSPALVLLPAILVAGFLALGLYMLFLGLSRAVREDDVAFVGGMGFFGSRTLSRVVAFLVAMRPKGDGAGAK